MVRGDGGNDGVRDVDSLDGTMAAGGPACGPVGWVALVLSPAQNNSPKNGDALVGALMWQKYRVYDEYVEGSGKFTRDISMNPRGERDMLDSKCSRRAAGGLFCHFSKRLRTTDQYDVKSGSNNVYLIYGSYDQDRHRVIAKTIPLGE